MSRQHGVAVVTDLRIGSYNLALRDGDGFLGDRVRSEAFQLILDEVRQQRRRVGEDPLGEVASSDRPAMSGSLRPGCRTVSRVSRDILLRTRSAGFTNLCLEDFMSTGCIRP